jgi:hypothetical protein
MMAEDSICIIVRVRAEVKKQQARKEMQLGRECALVFRRSEVNESVLIETGPTNSEAFLAVVVR